MTGRNKMTHRMTLRPGMAAKTEPMNTPMLIHKMFSSVNSRPVAGIICCSISRPPP